MTSQLKTGKAAMAHVPEIQKILEAAARQGDLLPRSLSELYDTVRDFQICLDGGQLAGCCALHPTWEDLGEIRSLVVKEDMRGRQIGPSLVSRCLEEARELGIKQVFVLTFNPEFFKNIGFVPVPKAMLPHKIWADCVRCVHFPDCKEQSLWIELGPG